jgi:hypothetical protein
MSEHSKKDAMYGYRRLQELEVINAVQELKATMENIERLWDEEVARYEESVMVNTKFLSRRNYPNTTGTVQDSSLFPYHTACYSLMDCYDRLNDGFLGNHDDVPLTSREDDDRDALFLEEGRDRVPSFHPNSRKAIQESIQNLRDLPERGEILLKLLKHSMSDFQADHRLSLEIVERSREWKCFQDVHFYRQLIAIVLLDRKICNGRCSARFDEDEYLDHFCDYWQTLERIIGVSLCDGVDEFSNEHALLVCAFFKITLDMANPSAGEKEDEMVTTKDSRAIKSTKTKLKQALYLWNMTDYDDDDDSDSEENDVKEIIPYKLLSEFVDALGRKAGKNRQLLLGSSSILSSFCNSVGTLVFIGETAVRRLPAKNDSIKFCSKIVSSFVGAYVFDCDGSTPDRSYKISPNLPSVIDPNRYANVINHATDAFLRTREAERAIMGSEQEVAVAGQDVPRVPKDVFDVIWSLFVRELADVSEAGCGYGDCLVWLGGEITGNDAFLFFSDSHNYPVGLDGDAPAWVSDEVRRTLLI